MTLVFSVLGIIVALLIAVVAWRFFALRSKGYPVMVRNLPADDGRHWRHGVLIYSGTEARLYKLRSLRPDSDLILSRLGTEVITRREPTQKERVIMTEGDHIILLQQRDKQVELAVDTQGDSALVSWIESGPSARRVRNDRFR